MFTSRPIGFVSSPYKETREIPKGLGAKHEADGVLSILPEFEAGLTDIEGFSHLVGPNPIGLTIVELLRREGSELHVRGVDMLDRTPLLDIKPLLSSIAVEKLRRGWLAEAEARRG